MLSSRGADTRVWIAPRLSSALCVVQRSSPPSETLKTQTKENRLIKKLAILTAAAAALVLVALAANKYSAPHSIVHVVTILWKEDSTPEQRQAALDGVKKMAGEIPGIKNVWIKATKVQGRGPAKDGK